jgi:hypothetical protein
MLKLIDKRYPDMILNELQIDTGKAPVLNAFSYVEAESDSFLV